MHEMQTIVTDVCGVCLSVRLSVSLSVSLSVLNATNDPHSEVDLHTWLHCAGSFGIAFAKLLWPSCP